MRLKVANRFAGANSGFKRKKYEKHTHIKAGGGTVRLMTQAEIWEVKCAVQKIIDGRRDPVPFRLEVEA
jgi:hypothetical protein